MVKTWGDNKLIQDIRHKLRILKRDGIYPYRPEYGYGYQQALKDALGVIRKVMHNHARVGKKSVKRVKEK